MKNLLLFSFLIAAFFVQGQDDCLLEANIAITTGQWASEISWNVYDSGGSTVASGGNYENNTDYTASFCIEDSCYTLELLDTFGDGWNGASLTANVEFLGLMMGPFTLETGEYGTFGLGAGDCSGLDSDNGSGNGGGNGQTDIWGCMDPAAQNYDASATQDCCCTYPEDCSASNTLTLVQSGFGPDGIFGGLFLEYAIQGANGFWWNPSYIGVNDTGNWVSEGCIADGCYNLTFYNYFDADTTQVDILINGEYDSSIMVGPGDMEVNVGLGINSSGCEFFVLGCTDPESPNYNPEATEDNGTCLEPCDCPDGYDPVCGYDYFSGQTITFNNPCELECAGAYYQWDGDCSEVPVYGCMDPEALNYEETATVDNGYCLYIPECGDDNLVVISQSEYGLDSLTGDIFGGGIYGYFADADGYAISFVGVNDGFSSQYGCLADGCYNFHLYSSGWNPSGTLEVSINGEDPTVYGLEADQITAVFAVGINQEDCEVYLPGCTDENALNYDPNATDDNGTCVYPFGCEDGLVAGQLYICTFSNGYEVALTITDSQGNVIFDQQGFPDLAIEHLDICLDPEECYTATMSNIAGGTSWNGGYFWLNVGNVEWVNGSLEGASGLDIEFGTGDGCEGTTGGGNDFTEGCTDPAALNYNPFAIIDDGSCLYDNVDTTVVDCGDLTTVTALFFQGDPFISEVSWALFDDQGNAVLSGDGTNLSPNGVLTGVAGCLEDGCYTLEVYDSFGDGWGGGLLILAIDDIAETYSLEEGEFDAFPIEIGSGCDDILTILGCTDPSANNYNPDATEDDGSCENAACPLIEVTIVTYTMNNGSEVSWSLEPQATATGDTASMQSDAMSDFGAHTYIACMAPGCYNMTLHDAGNDGWDQGWLEVWMDGELMTSASYQVNGINSMSLGIGADCATEPEVGDSGVNNPGMSGWDDAVDFSIYPTPTGEIVNILGGGFDNEFPVVVRVKDMMGKLIAERTVLPGEGKSAWQFDVSDWPVGIYTAEGTQGTRVAVGKVMVAR
ncbi:MAG: hypothetical protein L7S67_02380 [Flavobacteriales bacterium]|nr:hypothetical protein [Flavobacteriales bacterium]